MRSFCLLIVVVLAAASAASAQSCKPTIKGHKFDLSPLTLTIPPDYRGSEGQEDYYMNVCGTASMCNADTFICSWDQETQTPKHSLGVWTGAGGEWSLINEKDPDAGLKLHVANGDPCEGGTGVNEVTVNFRCFQKSPENIGVTQNPLCKYTVDFPTPYACPAGGGGDPNKKDGLSGGSLFIIIVVVSALLYLVVGVIWNISRTEKKGLEAIPHREFWIALPGLVKDGGLHCWRLARSGCRSGKDFQPVEEAAPDL